jgi:cobalt/nickel transport system ATP-binding protein
MKSDRVLTISQDRNERIVSVSCLKHTYPDTTEIHMCGLDFVVNRGERVVVLGGNGSGKTTLLYHILGLLSPDEGSVSVFGINPASGYGSVRERIGVLLQNVDDQILSPTVREDISFSPRNYRYGVEETARMVDQAMAELGIQHLGDKLCHYLSGGERGRWRSLARWSCVRAAILDERSKASIRGRGRNSSRS